MTRVLVKHHFALLSFGTTGTSPDRVDTDSDLLSDFEEINVHGTNPRSRNTDFDGLIDGREVNIHLTAESYGAHPNHALGPNHAIQASFSY